MADMGATKVLIPSASMSLLTQYETTQSETPLTKPWNRHEKKIWIITLFCGAMMLYAARTSMPICIAIIAKEFQWDKTQSGTVLSSFFWGYTMTQVLGGYLSDRLGGAIIIATAAVAWSLITFWTPQLAYIFKDAKAILVCIVISRVLLGCSQGFHVPSHTSIISKKVAVKERSLAYSIVSAGSHFGTLLSGSIGSLLLATYGWHSVFYCVGLATMCWIIFLRFYLIAQTRAKKQLLSIKDNILSEEIPNTPRETSVPWLKIFSKGSFWSLVVGHFCHSNAFFILLSWLPTYFHETFPTAKGWIFNVVPWMVSIPSTILSGVLADHLIEKGFSVTFVRKFIQSISFCGSALALVTISYTSSYSGSLICLTLAVAFSGFHNSGILVNPQDIAPRYAGSVFGIMNMAGAIPGFVGVYMAGHMLELTHSWAAVFNQTAAVSMFGWVIFTLFGTGKKIID